MTSLAKNLSENLSEKPRNTFGIRGYNDIIAAHLEERTLSITDYKHGFLVECADRQKEYKLLLDHKTLEKLYEAKSLRVIISFQNRQSGLFAVARILKRDLED